MPRTNNDTYWPCQGLALHRSDCYGHTEADTGVHRWCTECPLCVQSQLQTAIQQAVTRLTSPHDSVKLPASAAWVWVLAWLLHIGA
jgi:hypothetical protein